MTSRNCGGDFRYGFSRFSPDPSLLFDFAFDLDVAVFFGFFGDEAPGSSSSSSRSWYVWRLRFGREDDPGALRSGLPVRSIVSTIFAAVSKLFGGCGECWSVDGATFSEAAEVETLVGHLTTVRVGDTPRLRDRETNTEAD